MIHPLIILVRFAQSLNPTTRWKIPVLLVCLTANSMADTSGNWNYTHLSATTVTIDGCVTPPTGNFTIPDTITISTTPLVEKTVVAISANAFKDCTAITSVAIPSHVTTIGSSTFYNCSSLLSVSLPASLTQIGSSAFAYCSTLTNIQIPDKVTSIGDNAFTYCYGLTSITIPPAVTIIADSTFQSCTALTQITLPPGILSIGTSSFYNCNKLASITLPNSLTQIGNLAFGSCLSLTTIDIPSSVLSIGTNAFNMGFNSTSKLTKVTLHSGLTNIGIAAFRYCGVLTSITIPSSVTSIGSDAFRNCTLLTKATFDGNAPTMGGNVFGASPPAGFTIYYYPNMSGFSSPIWTITSGATTNNYACIQMTAQDVYNAWLTSYNLPINSDPLLDSNHDGVNLLMAFALDLNPSLNLSESMPKPVLENNQLSISYFAGRPGVTYNVLTSTDLDHWSSVGVTISAPDANKIRTASVTATGPKRFLKLTAEL